MSVRDGRIEDGGTGTGLREAYRYLWSGGRRNKPQEDFAGMSVRYERAVGKRGITPLRLDIWSVGYAKRLFPPFRIAADILFSLSLRETSKETKQTVFVLVRRSRIRNELVSAERVFQFRTLIFARLFRTLSIDFNRRMSRKFVVGGQNNAILFCTFFLF